MKVVNVLGTIATTLLVVGLLTGYLSHSKYWEALAWAVIGVNAFVFPLIWDDSKD